jgi:hypothetical protein
MKMTFDVTAGMAHGTWYPMVVSERLVIPRGWHRKKWRV